jgi:dolichol-phosphate mannosyltransferase
MKAMVIIPTYNERDNIESLLTGLLAVDDNIQVVVVDDNSPDGTGSIVDNWSSHNRRVHCVHRPGKLGLGTAYIAGFTYALVNESEYILTMDADFSHHPRFVPDILQQAQTADLVIGSRYILGGKTLNCTFRRKLLSWSANFVARLLLGLSAKDCTAGFRCYRSSVLHSIDFQSIQSNGYSYLIDMLYLVQSHRFSTKEVAIVFEDRRFGKSKISSSEIQKAIYTVLRLFFLRLNRMTSLLLQREEHKESSIALNEANSVSKSRAD